MTQEVWKHPGCELAGLQWPAASCAPCLPLVQECAGSGPAVSCQSSFYLREVLGLSKCDCGAGLAGLMLLPGCAATCIQAGRLQRCGAQCEIIEFMDICKTA